MRRVVEVVAFLVVWGFAGDFSLAETVEFADKAPCGHCNECEDCSACCSSKMCSLDDKKETANVALYQAFVERVVNQGDMKFAETVLAPDFVEHQRIGGLPEGLSGVEAAQRGIGNLRTAFPDAKMFVEAVYVRGDDLVARYRIAGTHTGTLDDIPPTGKKVDVGGIEWVRFKDGKAVAHWGFFDEAGMMRQLGFLPDMPGEKVVKPSTKDGGEKMSPEAAEKILRRFYDVLFNQRNLAIVDEVIASDFVDHDPSNLAESVEERKVFFQSFLDAFPDLEVTVEGLIVVGDKVITRVKMRGTNTGELMGMSPTGKSVTTQFIGIDRVSGGKIHEHWGGWDEIGFLAQLGLIPSRK